MLEISPLGRKLLVFFNIFLLSVFLWNLSTDINHVWNLRSKLLCGQSWSQKNKIIWKIKLFDPTATYLLTISIYSFLSDFSVKIQNFPVSRSRTCLPFLSLMFSVRCFLLDEFPSSLVFLVFRSISSFLLIYCFSFKDTEASSQISLSAYFTNPTKELPLFKMPSTSTEK